MVLKWLLYLLSYNDDHIEHQMRKLDAREKKYAIREEVIKKKFVVDEKGNLEEVTWTPMIRVLYILHLLAQIGNNFYLNLILLTWFKVLKSFFSTSTRYSKPIRRVWKGGPVSASPNATIASLVNT